MKKIYTNILEDLKDIHNDGRNLDKAICMFNDDVIFASGGRHSIFAGGTGVGKTTFCFPLALSIAAGEPFMRVFQPLKKFPVLYINNDQSEDSFKGRYLIPAENMVGRKVFEKANDRFKLRHLSRERREGCEGYIEVIKATINDAFLNLEDQNEPKVVFIDNCQRWFVKDLNNGGTTAMNLTNQLQDIADKHNVCFVIVTHLEKMGKAEPTESKIYGSSIFSNFADSVVLLYNPQNESESEESILNFKKGEACQKFHLKKDKINKIWEKPSIPTKECRYYRDEFYRAQQMSTRELSKCLRKYFPYLRNAKQIVNAKRQLCRAGVMRCEGQTYYGCGVDDIVSTDNAQLEEECRILKEIKTTPDSSTSTSSSKKVA